MCSLLGQGPELTDTPRELFPCIVGVSVSHGEIDAQMGAKPYSKKGEIKMKYEEFMRITDKWSDNDMILFLMQYPVWNEMVLRFVMHNWRDVVSIRDIAEYCQLNDIVLYTNLEGTE